MDTFDEPAVGAVYISNYRLIFYGNSISVSCTLLAKICLLASIKTRLVLNFRKDFFFSVPLPPKFGLIIMFRSRKLGQISCCTCFSLLLAGGAARV